MTTQSYNKTAEESAFELYRLSERTMSGAFRSGVEAWAEDMIAFVEAITTWSDRENAGQRMERLLPDITIITQIVVGYAACACDLDPKVHEFPVASTLIARFHELAAEWELGWPSANPTLATLVWAVSRTYRLEYERGTEDANRRLAGRHVEFAREVQALHERLEDRGVAR